VWAKEFENFGKVFEVWGVVVGADEGFLAAGGGKGFQAGEFWLDGSWVFMGQAVSNFHAGISGLIVDDDFPCAAHPRSLAVGFLARGQDEDTACRSSVRPDAVPDDHFGGGITELAYGKRPYPGGAGPRVELDFHLFCFLNECLGA